LTASDTAAVLGLNPWKSALDVYLDKLGLREPPEDSDPMWWGRHLEEKIGEAYSSERYAGRPVSRVGEHDYVLLGSKDHPFLAATLDFVTQADGIWIPLEIKNTRRGDDWDEGAPPYYLAQLQQQMLVCQSARGSIAGLLSGNRLVWQDVAVDEALRERIIVEGADFMRMVEEGEPPSPDGSVGAGQALRELYPEEEPGSVVVLDQDAVEWDDRIREIHERQRALKAEEQQLKNNLMATIGDAEKGVLPGGAGAWKWATQEASEYTVQRKAGRVLRRTKE